MGRRVGVGAFVGLVLAVLVGGFVQARADSPTYDEPVYVSAGLLALTQHDLAYNAEHPPLPKAIAAIPVLLTPYTLPPGHADGANRSLEAFLLQSAHQGRGQLPAFPAGQYRLRDWPDVGTAPELVGALKIARVLLRGPASADELRARCGVAADEVNACLWAYRAANLLEVPDDAANATAVPALQSPVGAFTGVLARIAVRFGLGRA